ncbi:MAG: hypothetical protein ACI9MR_000122 [Myxococcota bacterium]|jgi:hypothetical protein
MPFWTAERLSETELLDIVAWVAMSELPDGTPVEDTVVGGDTSDPTDTRDASDTADTSGDAVVGGVCAPNPMCDQDHPRKGRLATLTPCAHGVMGTATIVDGCTICVESFDFDGNGVDSRVYSGKDGDHGDGVAMSGDLKNFPIGCTNVTLRVDVPDGLSLDDVDGSSIWCVPVGVSFGDGLFSEP